MNIITGKKEIMKAIEKLNEATKLANEALASLEKSEKVTEGQKLSRPDAIVVNGVEYTKSNTKPEECGYTIYERHGVQDSDEYWLHDREIEIDGVKYSDFITKGETDTIIKCSILDNQ